MYNPGRKPVPKGLNTFGIWGITIGMMTYGLYKYASYQRNTRDIKIARVREREAQLDDMEKFRAYRVYHNDTNTNPEWMRNMEKLVKVVDEETEKHWAQAVQLEKEFRDVRKAYETKNGVTLPTARDEY